MAKTFNPKRNIKSQIKLIIFDFLYTLYDPVSGTLFSGVLETAKKLSESYPLVIISSTANVQERIALIKKLGLTPYFKEIIVSTKTPDLYLNVCKKYKAKPHETVVIGDNVNNEIAIAKEIGAIPVLINKFHPLLYGHDIYTLNSVNQLSHLLNKLKTK